MSKSSKSKSIVPNIANPSIPDTFVSLFNIPVNSPHDNVVFIEPLWYQEYQEHKEFDEKLPSTQEIIETLRLTDNAFMKAIENLEISLAYPLHYIGLPYYNNFSSKKDGSKCGGCCYKGCKADGHINSWRQVQQQDGSIITSGLCYCNTTSAKANEHFVLHRDACSKELLELYSPYKFLHSDLDDFVLSNIPIIQLLYIKKKKKDISLDILRSFREQYFNIETQYLLRELNGRISHSRLCFDPSKPNCKMDWGHLNRILFLNNIVNRIRVVVDYIDQTAMEIIEKNIIQSLKLSKKKSKSPKSSKSSKKTSKSPKSSKSSKKTSKSPKSPKSSKKTSKSPKSPKSSRSSKKTIKSPKKMSISMSKIGLMKLGKKKDSKK
jgi:hypothetical protein